jgi:hypothetical protein
VYQWPDGAVLQQFNWYAIILSAINMRDYVSPWWVLR